LEDESGEEEDFVLESEYILKESRNKKADSELKDAEMDLGSSNAPRLRAEHLEAMQHSKTKVKDDRYQYCNSQRESDQLLAPPTELIEPCWRQRNASNKMSFT